MVKGFDTVVFKEDLHRVHGPIKTEFGFHLIEILARY
jgi:peptidyl-prolyl cis-trans isomerase C